MLKNYAKINDGDKILDSFRDYGYALPIVIGILRLELPQNPCLAGRQACLPARQVLSPYPSFKR